MIELSCFGSAADDTFAYTVKRLCEVAHCRIFDLGELSRRGGVLVSHSSAGCSIIVQTNSRLGDVEVPDGSPVYARIIDISPGAPSEELIQRSKSLNVILNRALRRRAIGRTLNPPAAEVSNFSKVLHLLTYAEVAKGHGVRIPRSLLTSDPVAALEFIREFEGNVIYKGASSTKTIASAWSDEDLARLDSLSQVPGLFQERILGPDVRVHIVGDNCVAEMIACSEVDYRFRGTRAFENVELPHQVAELCRVISKKMQIPFVGIDFKLDLENQLWYFLEANSQPAYVGYDKRSSEAISLLIRKFLSGLE